jgi:hypothetical protein
MVNMCTRLNWDTDVQPGCNILPSFLQQSFNVYFTSRHAAVNHCVLMYLLWIRCDLHVKTLLFVTPKLGFMHITAWLIVFIYVNAPG